MTTEQLTTNNSQQSGQPSLTQRQLPGFAWVLLVIPILIFGLVWQQYAVNIPKWDDHALRAFLFYSDQDPTFTGKIYQLFKQHNEHRIVYDRLITTLDYWLFGKLNYVHLMLVGNLSLVGLLVVFMAVLRRSQPGRASQSVMYALPIALLLFNLSQWENMFWGMASLQNFSVVLWVIAAFYFLSYTNKWGLAFVAGVLATLTSGNGLMVWPIGFVLIALQLTRYRSSSKNRIYRPMIGWLVGAVVVIGLYFTGFEKPGGIAYVRPSAVDLLKGWFAVVGAAAEAVPSSSPLRNSILLGGLLILLTLGIIIWSFLANRLLLGQQIRNLFQPKTAIAETKGTISSITLFFWGCAGFILGTAAVVAWARTGFGIDLLITSRYKMYSLTGLSLLYLYVVVSLNDRAGRWWMIGSIVSSLVFAGLSYFSFLDETIWWRHWLTTNQFNWTHPTNRPIFSSDSVSQRYNPATPAFYDAALPTIYGPAQQPAVSLIVTKISGGFSLQNTTLPAQGLGDAGNYLLARSSKRTYLFPVWQNQQSIAMARFMPINLFTAGFKGSLLLAELDAGMYQMFVLTVSTKKTYDLYPTNQTIVSAGPPAATTVKNW
ncbi:hypothetical protein [Spirosoma flavum]|uniref:Glycosyltransferase RgtA/B/C/D-like domain-containing protein n=1 Tax=Spirosoma flavum TaxID=2048557 RepID=A0ABW6AEK6_9BACT